MRSPPGSVRGRVSTSKSREQSDQDERGKGLEEWHATPPEQDHGAVANATDGASVGTVGLQTTDRDEAASKDIRQRHIARVVPERVARCEIPTGWV